MLHKTCRGNILFQPCTLLWTETHNITLALLPQLSLPQFANCKPTLKLFLWWWPCFSPFLVRLLQLLSSIPFLLFKLLFFFLCDKKLALLKRSVRFVLKLHITYVTEQRNAIVRIICSVMNWLSFRFMHNKHCTPMANTYTSWRPCVQSMAQLD